MHIHLKPLPRSSGDLLADRRADYAEMLFGNGEPAAAAELMMGAMEMAPDWAMGWFRLGEFQEAAGATPQAIGGLAHDAEAGPRRSRRAWR